MELYHAQRARGMDFVTITDHNTLAGSLAIAHLPGTFLSAELDSWFPEDGVRVHVVALGIDEATFAAADAARENIHDLVAVLREADVAHYLAHPLFDMSGKLTPESVERMLLLFNVLEGRNGARTGRCNGLLRAIAAALTPEQLEAMAERQGIEPYGETPWRKGLTGGSDDHSGLFSASAFTVAGGDGTTEGFLRAVAAGDCDRRRRRRRRPAAGAQHLRRLVLEDPRDPAPGRAGGAEAGPRPAAQGIRAHRPRRAGAREDGAAACAASPRACTATATPADPRGRSCSSREIGSLVADPDGINAVDAKELNRRLFVVAQRLADDVMSMHLRALLARGARLGLKRRLQSMYAVGMVAFLELPYYIAWSFQSRDRALQDELRAYFLGERRHTRREKVAVLCAAAPHEAPRGRGMRPRRRTRRRRATTSTSRCSPARWTRNEPLPAPSTSARWPGGRRRTATGPAWVVPPLVEVVDYLEEEDFTAIHTDSAAGQGLVALAAARLLHLPVTGAVDPAGLEAPQGPGDLAGRLRRRYSAWFYGKLDEAYVADARGGARARRRRRRAEPDHPAAGAVERTGRRRPAGPEPGRPCARFSPRRRAARRCACAPSRRISSAFWTSSAEPAMPTCLTAAPSWKTAWRSAKRGSCAPSSAERRVAEALLDGGGLGGAGLGQREHAPALGLLALDQPLVLEQLERRVHRAGARPPRAAAALLEPLHDLVAVHRLVGEHQQDRRAHVAALGARPGAAAVTGTPNPGPNPADRGRDRDRGPCLTLALALAAAFAAAAGAEPGGAALAAGAAGAPAAPLIFAVRSASAALCIV